MDYHRGSMVFIIEDRHRSTIFVGHFGRSLVGRETKIDHFWSIFD